RALQHLRVPSGTAPPSYSPAPAHPRTHPATRLASVYPPVDMRTFVKASETYQQGQRTLPGRYYPSPEIYAEEQERIFTARWICVGRAAEIPAAGDYMLRTIAGESVIVFRGRAGARRRFYNGCGHRGPRRGE